MFTTLPRSASVVGGYLVASLIVGALLVLVIHLNWIPKICTEPMLRAHFICAAFGVMGASMAAMRKLYRAGITHDVLLAQKIDCEATNPIKSWGTWWVYYFVTRPIYGGFLGALVFLLSNVSLQIMSQAGGEVLSPQGRYILFGVACLSGYSVSHVLDHLSNASKKVFKNNTSESD